MTFPLKKRRSKHHTQRISSLVMRACRALGKPKRKSIAETLLRDMQGTAAQKLALFEKLKAAGGFDGEDRLELLKVENMLRTFAAIEKGSG